MNGIDALRNRAGGVEGGEPGITTPINETNVNPPDTPAWQIAPENHRPPGDPSLNSSSKPFKGTPIFLAPHPDEELLDNSDDMYDAAVGIVTSEKKASASLLQRKLLIGYARAARLLDLMEDRGIIGMADGARPREVYSVPIPRNVIKVHAATAVPQEQSMQGEVKPMQISPMTPTQPTILGPKGEYRPEYAQMMLVFFESVEKNTEIYETTTWRDGREREVLKLRPNAPPMFSEFARTLGVSERKLKSWARAHPDFGEAYEICAAIVKEFIVENGLLGNYPSQFAIFAGKNLTDMKDKVEVERRTLDVNKLLDDIESGKYGDGSRYELE